jgi:hypothetical protein
LLKVLAAKLLLPSGILLAVLSTSYLATPLTSSLLPACGYGSVGYGGSSAPTVSNVTPNNGSTAGGTTVTITGSGFCTATAVNFGSTAAASFQIVSDTEIKAVTPAEAAGTVDVTVTNPNGTSATSPADQFTFVAIASTQACVRTQPTLTGSDGTTWTPVSSGTSVTFTAGSTGLGIIGGNADLWTGTVGFNQDLGIAVTGTGFPTTAGQPEAWKESGGNGGAFSPNAAFVQAVIPVTGGQTYTAKLVWKTNHADSGTIFAGAGPVAGQFSNTCINFQLVASSALIAKSSTLQYTNTGSDGVTWKDIDAANLGATFAATANGTLVVTGNADLWTANSGFNQDIGIYATGGAFPTTAGQPEAWKESGGLAGTFSPNAAFVVAALPVSSGNSYTVKLQWKTNHADSGTIFAGAGPIGGKFSPTGLALHFIPADAVDSPIDKVSTSQYHFTGSDGSTWTPMDFSKFTLTYTPTNDCQVIVGANADLWTADAGFNQDIGIAVNNGGLPTTVGQPELWKESGGSNGTFSPNAAYGQLVEVLSGGHTYTFQLVWKANHADSGTIFAGAGPIGTKFSPTRLTLLPVGC